MIPQRWLNVIGDPVTRGYVSRCLTDAGRSVLLTDDAEVMIGDDGLQAVVMDHNTPKPWLLVAGAFRERGLLVVYIGRDRGNRNELNFTSGRLGCFRVDEPLDFARYFGPGGTWQPPESEPVRSDRAEQELASLGNP